MRKPVRRILIISALITIWLGTYWYLGQKNLGHYKIARQGVSEINGERILDGFVVIDHIRWTLGTPEYGVTKVDSSKLQPHLFIRTFGLECEKGRAFVCQFPPAFLHPYDPAQAEIGEDKIAIQSLGGDYESFHREHDMDEVEMSRYRILNEKVRLEKIGPNLYQLQLEGQSQGFDYIQGTPNFNLNPKVNTGKVTLFLNRIQ